jgi:hypothetical protein
MRQLLEYNTFVDQGKGGNAPDGYNKIRCHMIYDVKHDGRHKAIPAAGDTRRILILRVYTLVLFLYVVYGWLSS